MKLEIAANQQVISYLTQKGRSPSIAAWDSVVDPYFNLGSHPEIVERLWRVLASQLPAGTQCIFCGSPALFHPTTGAVFALAFGTAYALRGPGTIAAEAARGCAKTRHRGSDGDVIDISSILGAEWFWGSFCPEELSWCKSAYESYGVGTETLAVQTESDLIEFLKPWRPVSARAPQLQRELEAELGPQHCLKGRTMRAVAERQDCDDVLFVSADEPRVIAVVHLTYGRRPEQDPR